VSSYFSRECIVSSVVVPDLDAGFCGVILDSVDVRKVLLMDGHLYRDDTISISIPTDSQYTMIEERCPAKTSEDDVTRLADALASLPSEQFSKLLSLVEKKKTAQPRLDTDIKTETLYRSESDMPRTATGYTQPATYPASFYNPCRISQFSGDNVKGEIDYLHWRHEVRSLILEACPSHYLHPAIRKSLKGTAADVLLNMGVGATEHDILSKFDVIFGNVLSSETLLEDFYSARQQHEEGIAAWACRLETLLAKTSSVNINQPEKSAMLRTKFWGGLRDERVKNGIRHRYDMGNPFNVLLQSARQIEHETSTNIYRKQPKTLAQGVENEMSKMDTLLELVNSIGKIIETIEKNNTKHRQDRPPPICFYCGELGHIQRLCPHKPGNGR